MIDRKDWRWHGMPGHLIVSASCCFHLVTDIGGVRVSTIGCYHKPGDPKDYDHRHPIGAGEDSLYETLVFPIDPKAEPDEPAAQSSVSGWSEIDGERAATEAEAEAMHSRYCEKWAALDGDPEAVRPA